MPYFVKLVGIVLLGVGIVFFLKPSLMKKALDFAKVGKRIYFAGVGRIVVGGLLLLSIPHVTLPWITGIVGALILTSGILIFVLGPPKIHQFIDWIYNKSDHAHRIAACVAGGIGVLLIYAA